MGMWRIANSIELFLAPKGKKRNFITFQLSQVGSAHVEGTTSCALWFIWRLQSFKSKTPGACSASELCFFGQVYPVEKQNTALWLGRLAHWRSAHSQISLPGRGPNHTQRPSGACVKTSQPLGVWSRAEQHRWERAGHTTCRALPRPFPARHSVTRRHVLCCSQRQRMGSYCNWSYSLAAV